MGGVLCSARGASDQVISSQVTRTEVSSDDLDAWMRKPDDLDVDTHSALVDSLRGLTATRSRGRTGFAQQRRCLSRILDIVRESSSSSTGQAVGAVVRGSGQLAALLELQGFSASRLESLQVLHSLTADAYDVRAARTRAVLHHQRPVGTIRAFLYLSPNARCLPTTPTSHAGVEIRALVYYSLALLTNLMAHSEDAHELSFSGLERVRELADPSTRDFWAGEPIKAAALACLRNFEQRLADQNPLEQLALEQLPLSEPDLRPAAADSDESDEAIAAQSTQLIEARRLHEVAEARRRLEAQRGLSSREPSSGFHSLSAPLAVLDDLPLIAFRPVEDMSQAVCSVCLEEFVPGEQLRQLPCLHAFHPDCIASWAAAGCKRGCRCPNCREDFTTV